MQKTRQVGIAGDHFACEPDGGGTNFAIQALMHRIRHCVECPKCLTRYLIPRTPYRNGSYLVPIIKGSLEEYALYCSCSRPTAGSRWKCTDTKVCEVSKGAYDRGYGTPDEMTLIQTERLEAWPLDLSRYLTHWRPMEKGRSLR